MDLRQLETFLAVAEESSFTKAAQRVHLAQSAVSNQIRRLEREVGQPLFDRSTRAVVLTAAGRAVVPLATAALRAAADIPVAVAEVSGLVRGQLSVGTISTYRLGLPRLLSAFASAHPGIDIKLTTAYSEELMHLLRDGSLDAAVISIGPGHDYRNLRTTTLTTNRICLAVADGHPLAEKSVSDIAELGKLALVTMPVGTGIRHQLNEACSAVDVIPRVKFEADTVDAVAEIAGNGLGVGVLPEREVARRPELKKVELTPDLSVSLRLAWRADGPMSPAAAAFLRLTVDRLRPADSGSAHYLDVV